jgi:hypothetical protein
MARRFLIERRLRPHPTAVAERDREAPHLAPFAAGILVSHRTASALWALLPIVRVTAAGFFSSFPSPKPIAHKTSRGQIDRACLLFSAI